MISSTHASKLASSLELRSVMMSDLVRMESIASSNRGFVLW